MKKHTFLFTIVFCFVSANCFAKPTLVERAKKAVFWCVQAISHTQIMAERALRGRELVLNAEYEEGTHRVLGGDGDVLKNETRLYGESQAAVRALQERSTAPGDSKGRALHQMPLAALTGTIEILESRHPDAQVGFLEKSGTFPVTARFSAADPGKKIDPEKIRFVGAAFEIGELGNGSGVQHLLMTNKELTTGDSIAANTASLRANGGSLLDKAKFVLWHPLTALAIWAESHPVEHFSKEKYWSGGSIQMGERTAKYFIAPEENEDGGFTFGLWLMFQEHAYRQPIENGLIAWSYLTTPALVARIHFPDQDFDNPSALAEIDQRVFTPWTHMPGNRPLGRLNRVRKGSYPASANNRGQ